MFWERVLRHHYIMYKEQEEAKWGKGKRARKTVNYSEQGNKAKEKKDSDYMELSPDSSSLDEEAGDSGDVRGLFVCLFVCLFTCLHTNRSCQERKVPEELQALSPSPHGEHQRDSPRVRIQSPPEEIIPQRHPEIWHAAT